MAVQVMRNALVNTMPVARIMELHERKGFDFVVSNGQIDTIDWNQIGVQRLTEFLNSVKHFPIYLRSAAIVAGLEDDDTEQLLVGSQFTVIQGLIYMKEDGS